MRWMLGALVLAFLALNANADPADNYCATNTTNYADCETCALTTAECEDPCPGNSVYRAQLAHCMAAFCSGWPACSGLEESCPLCVCTPGTSGWGCLEWYSLPESPSTCKNTTSTIKSCVACSIGSFCTFIGFVVFCEIEGFDESMDRCMDKCGVASTCDWSYCDCSQFVEP